MSTQLHLKVKMQLHLDAGWSVDLWLILLQAQLLHILLHCEKIEKLPILPINITYIVCPINSLLQ